MHALRVGDASRGQSVAIAKDPAVEDADLDVAGVVGVVVVVAVASVPAGVVPEVGAVRRDAGVVALDGGFGHHHVDAPASREISQRRQGHGGGERFGAGARRRQADALLPQVGRHLVHVRRVQPHDYVDEAPGVHRGRAGGGVAALVAGDELVQPVVEGVVAGRVELAAEVLHLLDAGTRRDRGGGLGPPRRMRIPFGAGRQQDDNGGHGREGGRSPAAGRSRRSAAGRGAASVIARSDAHGTCLFLRRCSYAVRLSGVDIMEIVDIVESWSSGTNASGVTVSMIAACRSRSPCIGNLRCSRMLPAHVNRHDHRGQVTCSARAQTGRITPILSCRKRPVT